jgi:hypothetical protein
VAGRVTWNGEPLPEGNIIFAAADGAPVEDHGRIVAGEYRFRVKPGKKRVRIYASRDTGKLDPVMRQAERVQYLPERYNAQSTLEIDVTLPGPNSWDFPLTDRR